MFHCGSADVDPVGTDAALGEQVIGNTGTERRYSCYACDYIFIAYPCPSCESHNIEGSRGVSRADFLKPRLERRCRDCGERFLPLTPDE